MPVLGLVLLLEDALPSTHRRVLASLSDVGDLELGEAVQHRWPVVLDSPSQDEAEARIESLRQLRGVAGVDVVYADFEDLMRPPLHTAAREDR